MEYIKGNQVFYAYGEHYWVDIAAINNFQESVTDLIEVGDYVNGNRMDLVEKNEKGKVYYLQNEELPCVAISEIETILTHERYKINCYKVGKNI